MKILWVEKKDPFYLIAGPVSRRRRKADIYVMYVCAPLPFTVIYTCQIISYITLLPGGLADGSGSLTQWLGTYVFCCDFFLSEQCKLRFLCKRAWQLLGDWSVK